MGTTTEKRMDIQVTDKMTGEDWRVLTTWREHVFSPEGLGTDWIGGEKHILATSSGEAIAHIGFDVYTLMIDGNESQCIGVGAVVVVPGFQGQRLPKRMFSMLRNWRDENYPDSPLALFCPDSLVGYYENHNFINYLNDVFYTQKGNYQKSKFNFMTDRPMDAKDSVYIPTNPW
jgi:predicted GNAT family N-acyltransferase